MKQGGPSNLNTPHGYCKVCKDNHASQSFTHAPNILMYVTIPQTHTQQISEDFPNQGSNCGHSDKRTVPYLIPRTILENLWSDTQVTRVRECEVM